MRLSESFKQGVITESEGLVSGKAGKLSVFATSVFFFTPDIKNNSILSI